MSSFIIECFDPELQARLERMSAADVGLSPELGPIFALMGRDYDAAVMQGGLCGFMLGTTANAMANMEALVDGCL